MVKHALNGENCGNNLLNGNQKWIAKIESQQCTNTNGSHEWIDTNGSQKWIDGNESQKWIDKDDEKECDDKSDGSKSPLLCSQRWILAYMGVMFGLVTYIFRVNMSIAIVCMVRTEPDISREVNTSIFTNTNTTTGGRELNSDTTLTHGQCHEEISYNSTTALQTGEFTWDKITQSFVLSAYYYGYLVSQVPGGLLSEKYGGKHLISITMAVSAVASLLVPVLARFNVYSVMAVRVVMGICSGACIPGWYSLVGAWALPNERSRFVSACWVGQVLGTIVGYTTSGLLCEWGFDGGWPSIFYVHGIIGSVFVVAWCYCIYDTPGEHPRITSAESSLLAKNYKPVKKREKQGIPWVAILTYIPAWAVFIVHTGETWTFYLLLVCLPQFMKEVLKFDTQSNGLFSSLPFVTMGVSMVVSSWIFDKAMSKQWFTRTTTRKIAQTIGMIGSSIFVVIAGYITCEQRDLVVMCVCVCTFLLAVGDSSGFACNVVDMSPRYASVIFSISNTIATVPGMIAPLAVAELTQNQTSEEWRIVFFIAAGLSVLSTVVFDIFSSSELAPWADDTNLEIVVSVDKVNDQLLIENT